ncbi:A/G-specific adenine glycosylase [Patescibacteria group bacterium]|jgi:A/G-specific adenine glycosylase|nr:A/G-specific adenine glycosylase [Patescibacteria group bacterium]
MVSERQRDDWRRGRAAFRRRVWTYYREHRRDFPWRTPHLRVRTDGSVDPYRILVSEVMLQQTQTARVVEKYRAFITRFPSIRKLADAPLADVLRAWQGLGYNRRAKALHALARVVVAEHGGRIPRSRAHLLALPGIGPYTATSIRAFAFNEPDLALETNIRTVLLHHFFSGRESVGDEELLACASVVFDLRHPREWYTALMDYGAHLKRHGVRLNDRSRHYTKQSRFAGSAREVRGAVLRALAERGHTQTGLLKLPFATERITRAVTALHTEGMIERRGRTWHLAR